MLPYLQERKNKLKIQLFRSAVFSFFFDFLYESNITVLFPNMQGGKLDQMTGNNPEGLRKMVLAAL
jgi:hypothetical protein